MGDSYHECRVKFQVISMKNRKKGTGKHPVISIAMIARREKNKFHLSTAV